MKRQLAAAALATAISILLAAGIAVAVEGGKSQSAPPKADPALSQQSDESSDSESTESESSESTESDSESSSSESPGSESTQEHPENHGKYVSEAAKTCPEGPEHGACVRAVAKSDQGKKSK